MTRYFLILIGLTLFASSAYAGAISMTGVKSVGGTGINALPTNVVQVTGITYLVSGVASTNGQFNQLTLTLTASAAGTYTVYATVYVNGVLISSQTLSNVALSSTAASFNTGTFATQTSAGKTVEVDLVATG